MVYVSFNPRSPGGERREIDLENGIITPLSIHAPRAGSDTINQVLQTSATMLSIHAPRAGSDFDECAWLKVKYAFQSTLPGRGAT